MVGHGRAPERAGLAGFVVPTNAGHPAMARGRESWRRPMPPLAAMTSGFMVTLGLMGLVTVGPTLSAAVPSPPIDAAQSVNRSSKGDRLPGFTVDRQRPV